MRHMLLLSALLAITPLIVVEAITDIMPLEASMEQEDDLMKPQPEVGSSFKSFIDEKVRPHALDVSSIQAFHTPEQAKEKITQLKQAIDLAEQELISTEIKTIGTEKPSGSLNAMGIDMLNLEPKSTNAPTLPESDDTMHDTENKMNSSTPSNVSTTSTELPLVGSEPIKPSDDNNTTALSTTYPEPITTATTTEKPTVEPSTPPELQPQGITETPASPQDPVSSTIKEMSTDTIEDEATNNAKDTLSTPIMPS